jgi:hypothetical protein
VLFVCKALASLPLPSNLLTPPLRLLLLLLLLLLLSVMLLTLLTDVKTCTSAPSTDGLSLLLLLHFATVLLTH